MTEQQTDLLKEAGVISDQPEQDVLPPEMTDPEFLDSPLGRIVQTLAALELAAQSFSERIATCERYIMWLLAKDQTFGPKIAALDEAAKKAGITSGIELSSGAVDFKIGGGNEGRAE